MKLMKRTTTEFYELDEHEVVNDNGEVSKGLSEAHANPIERLAAAPLTGVTDDDDADCDDDCEDNEPASAAVKCVPSRAAAKR